MFVPFARPLFACYSNTDPSASDFSFCAQIQWGQYLRSTVVFHPIPATCVPDQQWHGPGKPFSGWNWIFPQYDSYLYYSVEPFHRQLMLRREFIGLWKNLFLPLTLLLLCFGIRMLDIQAFHYHKTHKNRSNHVAMLVFTCCALPISLRVVDSLRHTHAFSCVTLRDFLMKWATMAAPMVSENVCFKINFMMNNILTKLKKNTCVTIFYFLWIFNTGCMFL